MGSTFSMSAPITKVVKNDAYTAPRPLVPAAPVRPSTSMSASRSSAAALQQVSRTLQQSTAATRPTTAAPQVKAPMNMIYVKNGFLFLTVCVIF